MHPRVKLVPFWPNTKNLLTNFSPCVFFSRKLTLSECNTLSKYSLKVLTDHRNLRYILSPKALNSHQARWALLFSCFKFNLPFGPGCKNIKADALSHLPDSPLIISPSIILAPITWEFMNLRDASPIMYTFPWTYGVN